MYQGYSSEEARSVNDQTRSDLPESGLDQGTWLIGSRKQLFPLSKALLGVVMYSSEDEELNLELPTVNEVTRELFTAEVDRLNKNVDAFDVDEFLLRNNCNFTPLDSLIGDLSRLSNEMVQVLLEKVTSKYNDYLEFCEPYLEGNSEGVLELQESMTHLSRFIKQLEQLTKNDLSKTQEVISDTLDYLRKLDEMSGHLQSHLRIPEMISLAKQYSKKLHAMCGTDPLEEQLCTELTCQLHSLLQSIRSQLDELSSMDSTYVHHLRNEYHGLLQESQISLKILTGRCLEDEERANYVQLSKALISIL